MRSDYVREEDPKEYHDQESSYPLLPLSRRSESWKTWCVNMSRYKRTYAIIVGLCVLAVYSSLIEASVNLGVNNYSAARAKVHSDMINHKSMGSYDRSRQKQDAGVDMRHPQAGVELPHPKSKTNSYETTKPNKDESQYQEPITDEPLVQSENELTMNTKPGIILPEIPKSTSQLGQTKASISLEPVPKKENTSISAESTANATHSGESPTSNNTIQVNATQIRQPKRPSTIPRTQIQSKVSNLTRQSNNTMTVNTTRTSLSNRTIYNTKNTSTSTLPLIQKKSIKKPVTRASNNTSSKKPRLTKPRFAYVTYATNDIYACSAMVLLNSIRRTKSNSSIDLVIVHTSGVSMRYVKKIKHNGFTPILVSHLKTYGFHLDATWRDSMTKLNIFGLYQYHRVVYIDADALVLRNLDHLFHLPPYFLYGVDAYWLKTRPFINSQFFVIEPKKDTLPTILTLQQEIQRAHEAQDSSKFPDLQLFRSGQTLYDMDLLNVLYRGIIKFLPNYYVALNGDFRNNPQRHLPKWRNQTTEELAQKVYIVHFSESPGGGYGKPWKSFNHVVQQPRDAHALYKQLFQTFWDDSAHLCLHV